MCLLLRIASLSALSQGCFRGLTQLLVYYLVLFANNVFADRTHLSDLLLLGFISEETQAKLTESCRLQGFLGRLQSSPRN